MSDDIPLWKAAASGDLERVRELLCCGADPDSKHEGQAPLIFASANGQADVSRLLIANGVNVMSTDTFDMTALHWAVRNTHVEAARVLIEHGARTDAGSLLYGETPCDIARVRGDYDMCQLVVWRNQGAKAAPEKDTTAPASGNAAEMNAAAVEAAMQEEQQRRDSDAHDKAASALRGMRGSLDSGAEALPSSPGAEAPASPAPPLPERKRVPPPPERPVPRPMTPPRVV